MASLEPLSDHELLKAFSRERSEAAFKLLVERHVNLAFGAALRQLGNPNQAQDVAQEVFVVLARKAPYLPSDLNIPGWIHRSATLEAKRLLRTETRRLNRETIAVELGTLMNDENTNDKAMRAALDDCLLGLGDSDRQALILRFLEGKSLREVGHDLGISEDAAQKRIAKGLEKLSQKFRLKGFASASSGILATTLASASSAAPAGFSVLVTHTALQHSSALALTGLNLYLAKIMALTKTQTALLCLLTGTVPIAVGWTSLQGSKTELQHLSKEQIEASSRLAAMQKRFSRLDRQVAWLDREIPLQKNLAATRKREAWSEDKNSVEIPKELLKKVDVNAFARDRFTISPILAELLAIQPEEMTQIQDGLDKFLTEYRALEKKNTRETDRDASFSNNSPNKKSFVINKFAEEFQLAAKELEGQSRTVLGEERGIIFWKHAVDSLKDSFGRMGQVERVVTWVEPTDPTKPIIYYEEWWHSPGVGAPIFARGNVYEETYAPAAVQEQFSIWKRKQP